MYLMRQIGTRGVYGDPVLPDFMVFLNYKELPWFWHGFDHVLVRHDHGGAGAGDCWRWYSAGWRSARASPASIYRSSRRRSRYALMLAFFRNDMGFGGNNGMTDFKDILGFRHQCDLRRVLRCSSPARMALIGELSRVPLHHAVARGRAWCRRSAMPRAARASSAIGSSRTSCGSSRSRRCSPASPARSYVPQVGIINPSEFQPINSIEVVIWVAVGGRGMLYGAVAGAVHGELRQDLLHRGAAGVLALRAGPAIRSGDAVSPAAWSGC